MKAIAGRRYADRADLLLLVRLLGLTTLSQVAAVVEQVFPEEPLSPRSRLLLEDVLGEATSN